MSRKRNLLDDLEYAERVEALKRRRLQWIDASLDTYEKIRGTVGLGAGVKNRLVTTIFGRGNEEVDDDATDDAAPPAVAAVAPKKTTLTHLAAGGDDTEDEDEDEVIVSDGSPSPAPAIKPSSGVSGACNGPVTVAGVAMDIGLHDQLGPGARKSIGKRVSKEWKAAHGGENPPRFTQPWGRGVRIVNAYGEEDRGLIERVARDYMTMREECGGGGGGDADAYEAI
jgi:hypothetical protein